MAISWQPLSLAFPHIQELKIFYDVKIKLYLIKEESIKCHKVFESLLYQVNNYAIY